MSEMVERVARAIEATMFAPHELPLSDELHAKFCRTARAAIAAMRKPTAAMRNAVGPWIAYPGGGWSDDECDSLIEEVIDAALVSERGDRE